MIKRIITLTVAIVATIGVAVGQDLAPTTWNASNSGSTNQLPGLGIMLIPEVDGNGNYYANRDYTYSVHGTCPAPNRTAVTIEFMDIDPSDTLYIYDGTSTSARLLAAVNNSSMLQSRTFYTTQNNNTGTLTVRFRSNGDNQKGTGFTLIFKCAFPCETSIPVIENTYVKVHHGVVMDTCQLIDVLDYDTVITRSHGVYDTLVVPHQIKVANICMGDGVQFTGYGTYSNMYGAYTPTDAQTTFRWLYGNGDTLSGVNRRQTERIFYNDAACYTLKLRMKDQMGCPSGQTAEIYVRIAPNPIETIRPLEDAFCANDTVILSADYSESSSIGFSHVHIVTEHEKINTNKTYIPDGPNCSVPCYEAPITFSEFLPEEVITSAGDICSICVNYEHSYMGDYSLAIICPTQQKATFKYHSSSDAPGIPSGAYGGNSTYTGYPYGGSDDGGYDRVSSGNLTGNYCDSIFNMFGVGLDYCFSRNANYTLVDGYPANTTTTSPSSHYLAGSGYEDNVTYTFHTIPRPYVNAGTTCGTSSFTTKHPSNHDNKTDYYLPADDLTQLIGCPLNGTWSIQICDYFGIDNGWVFGWSIDLCNREADEYTCKYDVKVRDIAWEIDSNQGHFERGDFRGLHISPVEGRPGYYYATAIDTGGTFDAHLNIVDNFGCEWDTSMRVKTLPLPQSVDVVNKCPYEEYTWVDGNTYVDVPTPRPQAIFPAQTGCDSIVSLQLINDKIPEAKINAIPVYVTYDNPEVTLYDISEGSYYRTWYFYDETSNDAIATFTYPIEEDSLTVMLVAESQFHCPDTATITIPMDKTLIWVPNVFTPQKDDNAYFMVKGHNILDDIQVYIYNRMGALVSSWTGFEGQWDGMHAGKRCAEGAYTWVVRYHSQFEPSRWHYKTGTVTVLR